MDDVYENIDDYNLSRKKIVFDDMITDIMSNKISSHNQRIVLLDAKN